MRNLATICILLCVLTCHLSAQNKTIEGRVISSQFDLLIGVPIVINDTVEVGKTDLNGFFSVEIPVSEKKILFNFLGLDPTCIKLVDKCKEVEVVMMLSGTYDFLTPRKVDKLRMKRFKKLPDLHREAFEKGLFKTEKACYTQDFVPYYRRMKRN